MYPHRWRGALNFTSTVVNMLLLCPTTLIASRASASNAAAAAVMIRGVQRPASGTHDEPFTGFSASTDPMLMQVQV